MGAPNKAWKTFIPSGGVNDVVKSWHDKQPPRKQAVASPSTLTDCPRAVWLKKHRVPLTNDMGWGVKQRLMLGRITENLFAQQLRDEGKLLHHWKDDLPGESIKFGMGEGMSRIEGTPDLLINLDGKVLISDAKTSRADSFAYVPLDDSVWDDDLWYKYKLQVECYYLLCHKNKDWFQPQPRAWKDVEKELNNQKPGAVVELGGGRQMPLPEACHLFSYALDDGVVKRELTWRPTQKTTSEIMHYANRWNKAYNADLCPSCQCTETQTKFCPYGDPATQITTKTGYKLMQDCCADELTTKVIGG